MARNKTVGRYPVQMKAHRGDVQTEARAKLGGRHPSTRVAHRREHPPGAGTCVLIDPHD